MNFLFLLFFIAATCIALPTKGQHYGYAIIKSDTIFGDVRVNLKGNSVTIKQDSVNRMYLENIRLVTLLNESRDTYYTYPFNNKDTFFKALVTGEKPLLEKDKQLYCVIDRSPTIVRVS